MKKPRKRIVPSPLRYPGGKSKLLKSIIKNINSSYKEFREPFVGGGSVFLRALQTINSKALYKINDLNNDVYCFWNELKQNGPILINEIKDVKEKHKNGKMCDNPLFFHWLESQIHTHSHIILFSALAFN